MTKSTSKSLASQNSRRAAGNRVHHNIFEKLQQRIQAGDWLPGQRMPSIAQLAKEMQVGAGSIREALRALESINMVKIEHGSGVYVTRTRPTVELSKPQNTDHRLLLALAETRRILEPELAALAAERGTDEELIEIEGLARQMIEESQKGNDFAELDVMFHHKIAAAARNPILFDTLDGVRDLLLVLRRTIRMDAKGVVRSLRYHALIADALRARDAGQVRLLMQGEMNCMVDGALASETIRKSMENL